MKFLIFLSFVFVIFAIEICKSQGIYEAEPKLFLELVTLRNTTTYYAEFASDVNYTAALDFCVSRGMSLAEFNYPEDRPAVVNKLVELGIISERYHIAASNFPRRSSDYTQFYWISTGQFAFSGTNNGVSTSYTAQLNITNQSPSYNYATPTDAFKFICQENLLCDVSVNGSLFSGSLY